MRENPELDNSWSFSIIDKTLISGSQDGGRNIAIIQAIEGGKKEDYNK